jgi:hypothetical protein
MAAGSSSFLVFAMALIIDVLATVLRRRFAIQLRRYQYERRKTADTV